MIQPALILVASLTGAGLATFFAYGVDWALEANHKLLDYQDRGTYAQGGDTESPSGDD
jgi:hypothetical protein